VTWTPWTPWNAAAIGEQPAASPMPPPATPRGPCVHLGAQTGLRECAGCGGKTQLKVFACSHPAHTETTWDECQRCPDFQHKETPNG
jgi:hypothetical protein